MKKFACHVRVKKFSAMGQHDLIGEVDGSITVLATRCPAIRDYLVSAPEGANIQIYYMRVHGDRSPITITAVHTDGGVLLKSRADELAGLAEAYAPRAVMLALLLWLMWVVFGLDPLSPIPLIAALARVGFTAYRDLSTWECQIPTPDQ